MAGYDSSSGRSLFRGKKGKRLSGSFSPHLHSHEHDESQGRGKRTSMLRKSKKQMEPSESSGAARNLKNRISSPFDFQHLTHTNRHHFAALQEASENELVAGFRAVRASQAPQRNLTGIKAEDLHSSNCSTEDLTIPERRSISAMELRPHTDYVDSIVDAQEPTPLQEDSSRPSLRQTRSVESFSRPGINPRMHRHTQSANPPPRVSSRLPGSVHDNMQDTVNDRQSVSATTRTNRQSGVWDSYAPLSPTLIGGLLPSMAEEPDYVGHALTTPDNSAMLAITPPFSPGLEDVAEEPERFVSPRPAPEPPIKSPRSPRSPSHESFSFNQRSPISKAHNRRSSHALPKQSNQKQGITRPMSQMSDTLGSPGLTRRHSVRKAPSTRRKSNTWRVIEESWEDDIDYIYDNALEAECDLDWEHTSEDRDRTPEQQDHHRASAVTSNSNPTSSPMLGEEPALSPGLFAGNFRSSLLVPSTTNVPELELRSAVSSSTADTSVHTPSDYFNPHGFPHGPFGEADRFSFTPSLLGPQDYKEQIPREEIYDNLLADYEGLDRHFPLLEPTRSVASSTRSSHVRASKRSSYDSSLMSSGHGSGSWTAGVRRSASSAGSLPELVHSSRAPRQDFSIVVDKLADQVASFSSLDENHDEDDDATPPGHASQERTFFASDDEQDATESTQSAIDVEMKTSLELARQGSSASARTRMHHHKYASSDGAAKLLAPPNRASDLRTVVKSRSRAGSVPQKNRGPYLSLFPAPPKHSATSTPTSPLGPMSN
ncbi:hypothetical protein N0V90_001759 [Kalmusia sp. IMI 367209]|nr:hypothetical protein N0V90_001759 [Kalmusia sp. IMI 367209]